MTADDRDEHATVRKVLAGHQHEFRHLVDAHKEMLFAMILRQVGDRAAAEDLAQECFIRAYTGLKHFRFDSTFSTWLIRIALNHTNSYFVSRRYKERRRSEAFTLERHDMHTTGPDRELERRELMRRFQEALASLKPKFREVVVLCGLESKSYEEAAAILDVPVGTIRSRLNKARLLLKDLLPVSEVAHES